MRRRIAGSTLVLCALAMVAFGATTARAQSANDEKAPLYTYVSEWAVPRAMWADYLKGEAGEANSMNKLVADGTIVSYGSFSVLNHQEGRATHGSWFSAHSMASLMKVLEGLRAAPDATGPVFSGSKHWDYILESHDYNLHSGTFTNGYLRVGHWRFKAGSNDPGSKIMKATMVATLEKLFADGALHSYQIDEETIHSEDPGAFDMVIVANGAEGLDKFNAAVEGLEKNNPVGLAAYESLLSTEGHRDTLAHVDSMTVK